MSLTQGAEANRSGQYGEHMFEAIWHANKVEIVEDDKGYHGIQLFPRDKRLLIRQPRVDFEFRSKQADYLYRDFMRNISVLFEVKSQLGKGTTDEKLIHTIEDLARCPFADCCVVLFGDGFRKWVLQHAYRTAREISGANKRVRVIHAVGDVLYRHISHLIQHGEFRA